jgi:lipopolysaccharide/colanic/teichoic acid biosynthesis glycosyltransferase
MDWGQQVRADEQRCNEPLEPGRILGEILPEYHFLQQLRREKRRSDRTGSPFSLVTVRVDAGMPSAAETALLGRLLARRVRETDVVGFTNGGVGILLADTDAAAAKAFIDRLEKQARLTDLAVTSSTYPELLFGALTDEAVERASVRPLFLDIRPDRRGSFALVTKRVVDVAAAGVGLLLLSPAMLATALLVRASSPGPIIYKQARIGWQGTPFILYKFRSMICNADENVHREYVTRLIKAPPTQADDNGPSTSWTKLEKDPRITPIGHFIRKTGIDELPQLFNVIKGDLSIVGPRPPLPYEAKYYQAWHLRRIFECRPGITGLWQVSSCSTVSFADMVRLDIEYVRSWSLLLDLRIAFRTLAVVVNRCGAH